MTQSFSQLWKQAVDTDDRLVAQEAWKQVVGNEKTQNQWLIEALDRNPLPRNALSVVDCPGLALKLHEIAQTSTQINWEGAIAWAKTHGMDYVAREDLLSLCLNSLDCVDLDDGARAGLTALSNAMLNEEPSLADRFEDIRGNVLCALSMDETGQDWLGRSQLNVAQVLNQGLKDNLHRLLLMGKTEQEAEDKLNEWRGRHKSFDKAWKALKSDDTQRAKNHAQWCSFWLDNKEWHNTRLRRWCEAIDREFPWRESDAPMDHPVFALPGKEGPTWYHMRPVWAHHYLRLIGSGSPGTSMRARAENANAQGMDLAHGSWGRWFRPDGMDTLSVGLALQSSWLDTAVRTPAGAKRLQRLLERDWRAHNALAQYTPKQITDWLLSTTVWTTWKLQGDNLLGVFLDSVRGATDSELSIKKKTLLPTSLVLRVARQIPGVLLDTNSQGERVLDRLPLSDKDRAQVMKSLINQHVVITDGAPTRSLPYRKL